MKHHLVSEQTVELVRHALIVPTSKNGLEIQEQANHAIARDLAKEWPRPVGGKYWGNNDE